MAAHLRYLFDYLVSPWNRRAHEHHRREALLVYWRRLSPLIGEPEPTLQRICSVVRKHWSDRNEGEARDVTLRRLYRISGSTDPARSRPRAGAVPFSLRNLNGSSHARNDSAPHVVPASLTVLTGGSHRRRE